MADQYNPQPDLFGVDAATGRKKPEAVVPKIKPVNLRPDETFLTVDQVAKRYAVSKSTIWRWAKRRKGFPAPFEIAEGTTRWALSELIAFDRNLRRRVARVPQRRGR